MFLLTFIVVIYLAVVGWLGWLGYSQTKDASDYLLGGRKIHPGIMALSYGATFISTSAIVGFGGVAAIFGMGLLWLTFLNIFVGIFIAFAFFGKRTRKMGHNLDAHTFPELLGKRFDCQLLQGAGGLLIFVGMPLYASAILIGGAEFISEALKVDYTIALFFFAAIVALYVMMGGMKSVMYTDAFQGCIMFVGMLILLVVTYKGLGGVINAHESLSELTEKAIAVFTAKRPTGHQGFTSMPALWSEYWWVLVSTIVLGVGIGVLAQPQLAVRFMTVKSDRELNRAILVGGVFILIMTGVAFVVGALTNVYFMNDPEIHNLSIAAAKGKVGAIIPMYINKFMPPWFSAVFMVTLLAAAMSTLSSQVHTMGAAFGRDFLEKTMKVKGRNTIIISRLSMGFSILVSVFLAFFLPRFFEAGTGIIMRGTAIFFALCAAAFLPAYVGALYTKWVTAAGALAGFFSGALCSMLWLLFFHLKESQPLKLCHFLFGKDTLAPEGSMIPFVDALLIALPISIIVTVAVSLMTKPPEKEHLDKCFNGIK